MRRGCVSLGNIQCDECHRNIIYAEHYLVIEEPENTYRRLCVNCSLKAGLGKQESKKGGGEVVFILE